MKRSVTLAFLLMLSFCFIQGIAKAQPTTELRFEALGGDQDSVRMIAKIKNTGTNAYVMEAIYITMTYPTQKLYADARSIYNQYFARLGWNSDSDPLFRAFNNTDNEDTIQYGESTVTVGVGVTIPPNAPLAVCNFTFFPKTEPDQGSFVLIGNAPTAAYSGYYITTQINNVPFSPVYELLNYHWTPVEYISFTANQQGSAVVLRWVTASEYNNYGFFVQRRFISGNEQDWKQVAFVEGRGTTSSDITYIHFDQELQGSGTYEYRLVQQDFDGKKEISPVRTVEYSSSVSGFALEQNYPNPVTAGSAQGTVFKFSLAERSQTSLVVTNTLGKVVGEVVNSSFPAGHYAQTWIPDNLAPGMYIATLTSTGLESGAVQKAAVRLQIIR